MKKLFAFALTLIIGMALCVATTGCPSKDTKSTGGTGGGTAGEPKKSSS